MIVDNRMVNWSSLFYFIFSDNPKGVHNNFKIDLPYNILSNNNADNSFEDLRLMY